MCAKAISTKGFYMHPLETVSDSLTGNTPLPTLEEFGEALGDAIDAPVTSLGEDHIRISTPTSVDDDEIQSLREFIANSLCVPVTIFREKTYIEITAI
jgi:hypothetical protein